MSTVKSEEIRSPSAIQNQTSQSSPMIKSEFALPAQPPKAAFSCEYCGKEFNLKQYLIRHVVDVHGDTCQSVKPERVSRQPVTTESSKSSLRGETISSLSYADIMQSMPSRVEEQSRFECNMCQKVLSCRDALKNHIHITHSSSKTSYKCGVCSNEFQGKVNLDAHVCIGSDAKPFKCDICKKEFNRKCSLNEHAAIHSDIKPFQCDVCKRGFNQKVSLTEHMYIHSGKKPFDCGVCKRGFTRKANLERHLLIHSGTNPFSCEICKKTFSQKGSLKVHLLIHTGATPFSCEIC
eukprot:1013910_1